jgi:hypothetical protein
MDYRYIQYICSDLMGLKELPKLSIKDILKYPEPYKMVFLFYYGYSSMYKKYELVVLNRYLNKNVKKKLLILMSNYGNIKEIKYLVSKGIDIHIINNCGMNCYLIAFYFRNIRLIKYLESIGINIHKKTHNGNNAYLIANYQGNVKLMKHLEKKGINIYARNIGGNNYLNKKDLWPHYYKIAPYVFKNMNYKLNRFKIIYCI